MRFYFVIFLILILFLNFAGASQLSINNPEIHVNLKRGEEICKSIKITSEDYSGIIDIKDSWSYEDYRDLGKYKINGSSLGLKISHIKNLNIVPDNKQEVSVCFKSLNSGNFYGAIVFYARNSNVAIGNWIYLNITGEEENIKSKITGFAVNDSTEGYLIGLGCLSFILVLVLIGLLCVSYRIKNRKNH